MSGMRSRKRVMSWVTALLAALVLWPGGLSAQLSAAKPRLLVLPWLVIDRTTNKACSRPGTAPPALTAAAERLADGAQAVLDGAMHRSGQMEMIPRREWEPFWKQLKPNALFWQGPGCAVCSPAGQVLHYDRAVLQRLARSVRADAVWLGVTVVPLTLGTTDKQPDDCRAVLGVGREAVLARSSVLLVRASDGETVWQRDARQIERPARRGPVVVYSTPHSPLLGQAPVGGHLNRPYTPPKPAHSWETHLARAVNQTARSLGNAFQGAHAEGLR